MEYALQSMAKIMKYHPCIESERGTRRGSNLTLTWRRFSTATMAGQIAVDGDGVLREGALETRATIQRLGGRQQRGAES